MTYLTTETKAPIDVSCFYSCSCLKERRDNKIFIHHHSNQRSHHRTAVPIVASKEVSEKGRGPAAGVVRDVNAEIMGGINGVTLTPRRCCHRPTTASA